MALLISVREGFKTIKRNGSLFVLSLLVVAISLYLLSLFGLLTLNLYHFLKVIDEKIEIIAFLDEHADVSSLKASVGKISGVEAVTYVSADQALDDLQSELKETTEILNVFEENPLPASLRIKLDKDFRDTRGLEQVSSKIMLLKGIRETIYGGEIVDQLKKISNIMTLFDIGLLVIVIFSVIFVIFQTIKLTIFARAREIEIMKLVGASGSFIAIPFLFEGLVQGFLGGIIAFVLTVITYFVAQTFFQGIYFNQLHFLVGSISCGIVFGVIGSSIALEKFLK